MYLGNKIAIGGSATMLILVWAVIIMMGVGWVKNIIGLTQCDFEEPYKAEIIRIIGIPVAPVGGIVGYMDVGK